MTRVRVVATLATLTLLGGGALAAGQRDALLADYAAAADGAPFSAARGEAFFTATHSGGKPDTPSCTTCHTADPTAAGRTRAGKAIDPMAVSASPARFTDPAKVEKWFLRNCKSVVGRECTAIEKGDVITWLSAR